MVGLHQDVVRPIGNHVLLAGELRDPERVDHGVVGLRLRAADQPSHRLEIQVHGPAGGDHHDVGDGDGSVGVVRGLHVGVRVDEPPPPLMTLDRDVEGVRRRLARQVPDGRHRRHHDDRQDDRGHDRPADLQARVAVDLRGHPLLPLAMAILDDEEHDPALDDHEDEDRHPEHRDEEVLDLLRVRTCRLQRILAGMRSAGRQHQAEGSEAQDPEQPLPQVSLASPVQALRRRCGRRAARTVPPSPPPLERLRRCCQNPLYECSPTIQRFTA